MKIEKAIVIPDVHAPYHDHLSIGQVLNYMEGLHWDYLIFLGDFLDYFCISRFNEGQPGMIANKTILSELQSGAALLDKFLKAAKRKNPKCKVIYLEGNHEARSYQFASMFPHLKGLIEPEVALKFNERGIKYVRSWSHSEPFHIGKAYFAHGRYTNMHHAKKMVENYEENVFYGHTHDINCYSKTSMGTGHTKVGQSLGCLCDLPKDVDYTKGAPSNWQQGFTTFYFLPNGYFYYYITRIFNHTFVSTEAKLFKS